MKIKEALVFLIAFAIGIFIMSKVMVSYMFDVKDCIAACETKCDQ